MIVQRRDDGNAGDPLKRIDSKPPQMLQVHHIRLECVDDLLKAAFMIGDADGLKEIASHSIDAEAKKWDLLNLPPAHGADGHLPRIVCGRNCHLVPQRAQSVSQSQGIDLGPGDVTRRKLMNDEKDLHACVGNEGGRGGNPRSPS